MDRNFFAIAAIVFAFVLNVPARADFTFFHGGHSYLTVTTPAIWADAAGDAASRQFAGVNGALARIDDVAENNAIIAALRTNISSEDFVWIGATDRQDEGEWIWDGDADGIGDQFWQACPDGTYCTQLGWPVGGLYNDWFVSPFFWSEPDDGGLFLPTQDAAGISLESGRWADLGETNALYYLIEFSAVPQSPPGDYNVDGFVDAADFVAWRKHPGAYGSDPGGYNAWRANFGAGLGAATSPAVPEPATWGLLLSVMLTLVRGRPYTPTR